MKGIRETGRGGFSQQSLVISPPVAAGFSGSTINEMQRKKNIPEILEKLSTYTGKDVHPLAELVDAIRPSRAEIKQGQAPGFQELTTLLREKEAWRRGLTDYLARLVEGKKFRRSLIDAGIVTGTDFWYELRKRISYKILPYQPEENTIEYILVNVFYKASDAQWIQFIEEAQLEEFFELLGFTDLRELAVDNSAIEELLFSARVLAHRITGRAFESEVLSMVPEYENFESPFVALQDELNDYLDLLRKGEINREVDDIHFKHIQVLIGQCSQFILQAYKNREQFGISFKTHQNLMAMSYMLERLQLILELLVTSENNRDKSQSVDLAMALIKLNAGSNHISSYFNRATQLMANEITQHTGRKGEQYITYTASEYRHMLRTALGGGGIVGVLCLFKLYFAYLDLSLFGQAFLYSMNYAAGFILIYLTHQTLATKQPAMTAATLAQALDSELKGKERYLKIAELAARTFRSQFIAFVGNVFMAFPVALLLVYLVQYFLGFNFSAPKAEKLIGELHPLASPAIFHAGIAGIFLFISGLIAGSATNKSIHQRVPLRIRKHPLLRRLFSETRRRKMAAFYDRNIGGIMSNLWFGIFLGSTATVGVILGLPLDIRHITFAAGNFALGLFGAGFAVSTATIIWSVVGIGIIGFMNFIVSFSLSLMLAMRSRGIPLNQLSRIYTAVQTRFFNSPWTFFFPPRSLPEEQEEEVQ